ncbi:MAG: AraC family transcriptional regulator [Pseudomonadota bacterium]
MPSTVRHDSAAPAAILKPAPAGNALQVYPAHATAYIIQALTDEGVPLDAALRDSGIDAATLYGAATRLSAQQILTVIGNALALARTPGLALRAGSRMHVAACGIYGYALLSSPSHLHAAELAARYDRMLHPLTHKRFIRHDGAATWIIEPVMASDPAAALYQFTMEMKLASTLTVMRDLYSSAFRFGRVRLRYPAPAHAAEYRRILDCDVLFGQESNDIRFDEALMHQPMRHADPITNAMMRELCEQALQQVDRGASMSGAVQAMLMEHPGQFPDIEKMALALALNARTLRRRLEMEQTSYRAILNQVRMQLALSYLKNTDLTNEEIAVRLGYSDAANFRHAFARWTGAPPGDFRARGSRA